MRQFPPAISTRLMKIKSKCPSENMRFLPDFHEHYMKTAFIIHLIKVLFYCLRAGTELKKGYHWKQKLIFIHFLY